MIRVTGLVCTRQTKKLIDPGLNVSAAIEPRKEFVESTTQV